MRKKNAQFKRNELDATDLFVENCRIVTLYWMAFLRMPSIHTNHIVCGCGRKIEFETKRK